MITAERKPMEELIECLKPYGRILLAGCNECVTVCAAGGRKEVALLASSLRMAFLKEGKVLDVTEITLERQCDPEYVEELVNHMLISKDRSIRLTSPQAEHPTLIGAANLVFEKTLLNELTV